MVVFALTDNSNKNALAQNTERPNAAPKQSTIVSSPKNLLEDAIDPVVGNKEKWGAFTDAGGLNNTNYFHGIPVESIKIQWKANKTIDTVVMSITKAVSPRAIRESLNAACGTTERSWVKEDGALTKGIASNGKIRCDYLTNSSASYYDVAIMIAD